MKMSWVATGRLPLVTGRILTSPLHRLDHAIANDNSRLEFLHQVVAHPDLAKALQLALVHDLFHGQLTHLALLIKHLALLFFKLSPLGGHLLLQGTDLFLDAGIEGIDALATDFVYQPLTLLLKLG
jgi:hypothetical protein